MQTRDRPIAIANQTLNTLIRGLGVECQSVLALINQLQLPNLTQTQQAEILANLLATAIHLHSHCDDDFQTLIANAWQLYPIPTNPNNYWHPRLSWLRRRSCKNSSVVATRLNNNCDRSTIAALLNCTH